MNNGAFYTDPPLKEPKDDLFGYTEFAQSLTRSIASLPLQESITIGIFGKWGDGKTTMLNFIEHYLSQLPYQQLPYIVKFNPWWFSAHNSITDRFFCELRDTLSCNERYNIANAIDSYGNVLATGAAKLHPHGWLAKLGLGGFQAWWRKFNTLENQKNSLESILRNESRKIVVIIDDLDRLNSDEIVEVFSLVKGTANLPNIIYVLAFDNQIVDSILNKSPILAQDNYLEKIIQVPFNLPCKSREDLRELLIKKIETVLKDSMEKELDSKRWSRLIWRGFGTIFQNARQIHRYCNALLVTFNSVKGEVNPVDFLGLECLRIFFPEIYQDILNNQMVLTNSSSKDAQKWLSNLIGKEIPDEKKEAILEIVKLLFPTTSGSNYSTETIENWRKETRVCHSEFFPIYFLLSVPQTSVRQTEIEDIIKLLETNQSIHSKLIFFRNQPGSRGHTKARELLERLSLIKLPSTDSSKYFVHELLIAADELMVKEDEPLFMLDTAGNAYRLLDLLEQQLLNIDTSEHAELLAKALKASDSIRFGCFFLLVLMEKKPVPSSEHQFANLEPNNIAEIYNTLFPLVLDKIQTFAKEKKLLNHLGAKWVLNVWEKLENTQVVNQYLDEEIKQKDTLVNILATFECRGFSSSDGIHSWIDLTTLTKYLNIDLLEILVLQSMDCKNLNEEDNRLFEISIKSLNLWKQNKDPSNVWFNLN